MAIFTLVSSLIGDAPSGVILYRDGLRTVVQWPWSSLEDASAMLGPDETVNRMVNEARIAGVITDEDEPAFRAAVANRAQTTDPDPYTFELAELGISGMTQVKQPIFLLDDGVTLPTKPFQCRSVVGWQQDLDVHGDEKEQVLAVARNALLVARDEHHYTHVQRVVVMRTADERLHLVGTVRGVNVGA